MRTLDYNLTNKVRMQATSFTAFLLSVVLLVGIVFSGCSQEEAKRVSLNNVVQVNTPEHETKLRIAISAIISPKETFVYYKDILDYISEKTDMPVELIQRDTYAEVNELIKKGEIDCAFVCSGPYVEGHDEFGMELLVAPEVNGETSYYSYIIVPVDSGVESFEELRGKTFAFTDPMSNTGKLVPTYLLSQMNETPDSFFDNYIFTYSHDKSIKAVATKFVDGAAVDSLIWEYFNATNPTFTSKTKIIWKSQPFGIPPVVVPKNLDPEMKERLREIFLHMHKDSKGREILSKLRVDRFVVVNDSIYDSVREMKTWVDSYDKE